MTRVREITPLEGHHCRLLFEDGTQKVADLRPYLHGKIFEPLLNDIYLFRSVRVVEGVIAWENGADIDPDVLYYNLKPAWMEAPVTR
ncbi:MAG: DUF2442 domain-containing protein [Chloroflexi bacterium]|nr:DUF2442 domain-containing protein [Chloroflexota bacterium]